MHKVHLHGRLKTLFGGPFSLSVFSVAEVVRALSANFKDFAKEVRDGAYRIIIGDRRKGRQIGEEALALGLADGKPIHIIPVTRGSKKGGTGKLIAGIALIAVAAVATGGFALGAGGTALGMGATGWSAVAMMGASFAFAGVAQLLTPTPPSMSAGNLERPEERPSFLMNSPVNVSAQGNPIPIIGGRVRVGSIVGSMGFDTDRIAVPA